MILAGGKMKNGRLYGWALVANTGEIDVLTICETRKECKEAFGDLKPSPEERATGVKKFTVQKVVIKLAGVRGGT